MSIENQVIEINLFEGLPFRRIYAGYLALTGRMTFYRGRLASSPVQLFKMEVGTGNGFSIGQPTDMVTLPVEHTFREAAHQSDCMLYDSDLPNGLARRFCAFNSDIFSYESCAVIQPIPIYSTAQALRLEIDAATVVNERITVTPRMRWILAVESSDVKP